MKKVILALSLVFVTGSAYALPPAPEDVGEIKKVKGTDQGEATRVYKLVRSSHSAANSISLAVGDAVVYDTVSDDGVSVKHTTTSADTAFAGIVVTEIPSSDAVTGTSAGDDAGRRNWGYIQVHGPADANVGGTNAASLGDFFITSSDAGKITGITTRTASSVGAAGLRELASSGGFYLDAPTTSASAEVFLENE